LGRKKFSKHWSCNIPKETSEQKLRWQGYRTVVGIDEVGRAALAGPLVLGAVVLPEGARIQALRDSKLLTLQERERIASTIKRRALAWGIGIVSVSELNVYGLGAGLAIGAQRAVAALSYRPDVAIVDGRQRFAGLSIPQQTIVKADRTVRCVAAASVVAKVARDRMMRDLVEQFPGFACYGWQKNVGYPTRMHRQVLAAYGPTVHHRIQFAPVRAAMTQQLFMTG